PGPPVATRATAGSGGSARGIAPGSGCVIDRLVAEEVLQPVPARLEAHEREAKVGNRIANRDVRALVRHLYQHDAAVDANGQAAAGQSLREARGALLDLDRQGSGSLGKAGERGRPQQPSRVDRQQVGADPLDLAQEMTRNQGGDPELQPGPA